MNTSTVKKASPAAAPTEDWHPSDILAALHKAGWTVTALGRHHGLKNGNTISKALTVSYPIAEKRIAEALDLSPCEIWPSRYYENGEPKPRGFRGLHLKRFAHGVNVKDKRVREHDGA